MTLDRTVDTIGSVALAIGVAMCLFVALGCSMTPAEKLYIAGSAADLATTAYGLEHCANGREGNPILTLAGDDTASVVLSGALLRWGLWKLARKDRFLLRLGGGLSLGVAGHNASVIRGCE